MIQKRIERPVPGINQQPAFQFGAFQLDIYAGELRKRGVKLKLQDQPRQILTILLEHAGEVVTREEIQSRLWPENTHVDFDNAINSAVRKLRDALGDEAENPRFIETLARRGYRFVAPVSTIPIRTFAGRNSPPPTANDQRNENPAETRSAPSPALQKQPIAPKRGARKVIPVVALTVIATGLGLTSWIKHAANGPEPEFKITPLTTYPGNELFPSFSPDGTRVVFSWDGPQAGNLNLYVKLIGPGDPIRLTTNAGTDFSPAWSPDGLFIAFLRTKDPEHSAVLVMPALGGQPRELTEVTLSLPVRMPPPYLSWSADGKWLFALHKTVARNGATSQIVRISVETGDKRKLTFPPRDTYGDSGLAISPEGNALAFTRTSTLAVEDIYVVPLSKEQVPQREPQRVTFDGKGIDGLGWTLDGRDLMFSSTRGGSGRSEMWRVALFGGRKPMRVAGIGEELGAFAVSRQGRRLAYVSLSGPLGPSRAADYDIWRVPLTRDGVGPPVDFISSTRNETNPQYSPDGARIAFMSNRSGTREIWVVNADGSSPVQMTSFGTWAGSPAWSPDSQRIAFDCNVTGAWNVYVLSANGGNPTRLTWNGANNVRPSWSHDGNWIYYSSNRTGRNQIWKIGVAGKQEIQVTKNGSSFTPIVSADGQAIYYTNEGGLWKVPAAGGSEARVLASVCDFSTNFAATRHGIYFFDRCAPKGTLWFLDLATGSPKQFPISGMTLSVSPDERWLIYGKGSGGSDLMLVENFR